MAKVSSKFVCSARFISALCAVILIGLFAPPAFMQQQGGSYTLHPSVFSGGGGSSANGNSQIEGSFGQQASILSGATYTVASGFWPGAAACPAALSPAAGFFTLSGGSGSLNVIAPAFCNWNATASENWLMLTSGASGAGNGVVAFETRENFTGGARQAVINVSGYAYLVVQDAGLGADCGYFISPAFQAFTAGGGSGTINVTAEQRCGWQATTSVGWVTLTASSVGIGNGTVSYSVAPNPGASGRKAFILIGGRSFSVKQKGN